ncbi:MAG: heparinase II/III family protein [bacterium]
MDFLKPPYSTWSPEKLCAHFRGRKEIEYFPVEDHKETTPEKMAGILDDRFETLGETFTLPAGFDWQKNPSQDIEWHIMLHKFYYAVGLGRYFHESGDRRYLDKWVELTESWIDQGVEPGLIASDVTGRRIQNWIFAHYYFVNKTSEAALPKNFFAKFLRSLHEQASWLIENLTPGRNHRTLELYAIFLTAVVFPEMHDADYWLDFSKQELFKNMQEDFQQDGVHCEQSTDYHHIVLRNFLGVRRLAKMNNIDMPDGFDALIQLALEFAKYCHKPDGFIPSLSDGDAENYVNLLDQGLELYHDPELLYVATKGEKGRPPKQRSRGFTQSGYYFLRGGWGENGTKFKDEQYLVFDCGPLGRGNHGHFDLLSFELYAYGRSLIVDPGRYTYDESGDFNWRVLFRGTSYHNTVTVDGKNQTRYLFNERRQKFKIKGPAPDYEMRGYVSQPGFDYLHGIAKSHEYDTVHERKIFFACLDYWIVTDLLTSIDSHRYDLRFHLSPQAKGRTKSDFSSPTGVIDSPNLLLAQPADDAIDAKIDEGFVSQFYGVKHAAPIVTFSSQGRNRQFHTVLFPYKKEKPKIELAFVKVRRNNHICSPEETTALKIQVEYGGKQYTDYYFTRHRERSGAYCFAEFTSDGPFAFVRVSKDGRVVRKCGEVRSMAKTECEKEISDAPVFDF